VISHDISNEIEHKLKQRYNRHFLRIV